METPVQISWVCYGCFQPVYSYLGKTAPCVNCEPTVYEDDDAELIGSYWVNGTGIEITTRSIQIEQDAAWEEYDFRMDLLERDWEEVPDGL